MTSAMNADLREKKKQRAAIAGGNACLHLFFGFRYYGAKEIPAAVKKEPWASFGVNFDKDFEPLYIIPPEKRKVVAELKDALKNADELILATDEDREGESIGWHLTEVLKPKVPVKRMVFSEITKAAIQAAIASTRASGSGIMMNARNVFPVCESGTSGSGLPSAWDFA